MTRARTPRPRRAARPDGDEHLAHLARSLARAAQRPEAAAMLAVALEHAPALESAATLYARTVVIAHHVRVASDHTSTAASRRRLIELAEQAERLGQHAARTAVEFAELIRSAALTARSRRRKERAS